MGSPDTVRSRLMSAEQDFLRGRAASHSSAEDDDGLQSGPRFKQLQHHRGQDKAHISRENIGSEPGRESFSSSRRAATLHPRVH